MNFASSSLAENKVKTFDDVGKWDDPNPSTQVIPRDTAIVASEIREIEDASNVHNPLYHINQQRNYKKNKDLSKIFATRGNEENAEVRYFFQNTNARGENNYEDGAGNNPIYNDNQNEARIRFGGRLNLYPFESFVTPPGTNEPSFVKSTTWDKHGVKEPANPYLDMPLLPVRFGEADLRADTQMSSKNTDTGDNPLKLTQYLDRNPLFDENRD